MTPGPPPRAELADVAEPQRGGDELLVEMVALGVCGTDREIVAGKYGRPPPGSDSLVLGDEWLGRVLEAPPGASVGVGELVARREPDDIKTVTEFNV